MRAAIPSHDRGLCGSDVSVSSDQEQPPPALGKTTCIACGAVVHATETRCSSCGLRRPTTGYSEDAAPTLFTEAAQLRTTGVELQRPPELAPSSHAPIPNLGQTMRLGAVDAIALERAKEGETAGVAAAATETAAPYIPSRRSTRRRLPLLLVVLAGVAGVALAALLPRNSASTAVAAEPLQESRNDRVRLDEYQGPLGLSVDNKEVVLSLCFQLSRNADVECRLSYLREIGEFPARNVSLGPFAIDRYEVSNAEWSRCEDAGECHSLDRDACSFFSVARGRELRAEVPDSMFAPSLPVVCVTHDEAATFCQWSGGELPTSDRWERAARSGDDRLQPWGPFALPGLLNWGERILRDFPIPGRVDGHELTAPVGEYRSGATDEGVHNLLGNVSEWVADSDGSRAGVRGGSYTSEFQQLRVTHHETLAIDERRSNLGFRCVE